MMNEPWSDDGAPLISPDETFRQELARALQDTHHRQRVQRQRHGLSPARRHQIMILSPLSLITLLALLFGIGFGVGYSIGRRTA